MSLVPKCCHGTGYRWDYARGDFAPCECRLDYGTAPQGIYAAEDGARADAALAPLPNAASAAPDASPGSHAAGAREQTEVNR